MSKYIVRVTEYVYHKAIEVEASSCDEAVKKVGEGEEGPWEILDREVNFDVEEK
tara:strand:- start:4324 stop:4485 length:162 start_codon:yes stop_codon:yes gene_type:complete